MHLLKFLAFSAFLLSAIFQQVLSQNSFVIENVHVISMVKETVEKNKSLIIRDGKLVQVVNKKQLKIPLGAERIDGKGAYVIPGLFDMHLHFYHDFGLEEKFLKEELKLAIANGVTSVRIMDGQENYLDLKKRVNSGELVGPELFVASPQFVGKWPFKSPFSGYLAENGLEASRMVKVFKDQGYSEIKLAQFISPEIYDAVTKAAREAGIKITGHVGPDVKLYKALHARQQIEHMDEFIEALLSDTLVNGGKSVSDVGIWNKKAAWPTLEYVDESKTPLLVERVKSAGIYVTPTNYFFINFFARETKKNVVEKMPGYPFVPAFHKKNADQAQEYFWKDPPPEKWRTKYINIRYQLVNALYKAGVKLMAGSDGPEWYLTPGFALHNELDAFREAGLNNYAILQTATINPARYLGIDDRKGTIEVGKDADFILLRENPLDDILNTRTIEGVFTRKKYFNRQALDTLLSEARIIGSVEKD